MNSFFVLASAFLSFSLVSCMSHDDDYERPVDIKIGDGYHESDYYYEPEPDYYHDSKPTDDYYLPEHTDNPPQHTNYGYKDSYDCGPLPDIKNGRVEINPDTKKASIAMYFCDEGFLLYGVQQRVCSYGGRWSGKAPKCIPIDCGYLPNIRNGRLILSGTGFRDTATYLCKEGFDLIGDRQRKCGEDGEWSTSEPKCEKISCPKLSPPDNGKVFLSGIYPSDVAYYSCSYGFYLDGQKRRVCERTGEWSGTDPECKKIEPIPSPPPKKDDHSDDDYYYDDDYQHYGY